MFKPFALFFFIITVVWAGSILVTTDPYERLHRSALPIALVGKGTVAVVVQVEPAWAAPVYNFFLKTEHGFKYMLWSVFYEEEWRSLNSEKAGTQGNERVPGGSIAAPPPARSASSAQRSM
jgi:hypothetical protein